jgi:hypothetical protein
MECNYKVTEKFVIQAISSNPGALQQVEQTPELLLKIFAKCGGAIKYANADLLTLDHWRVAINHSPATIQHCPEQTEELQLISIESSKGASWKHIKGKNTTAAVVKRAVELRPSNLNTVKNPSEELILTALRSPDSFGVEIHLFKHTDAIAEELFKRGILPSKIDKKFWTEDRLIIAVRKNPTNLGNIPAEYQTPDICQAALDNYVTSSYFSRDRFIREFVKCQDWLDLQLFT